MNKKKLALINIFIFFGILISIEGSIRFAVFVRDTLRTREKNSLNSNVRDQLIPTKWEQVFHPSVGHSHQLKEFERNVNTAGLNYDNISATEVFQKNNNSSSQLRILTLGGSTTDPLGTHKSGYRGTWVHHLFEEISQKNEKRFIVENAGNGGSNSSNELLRLITKLHQNNYDLVISFNGINEYYFLKNPYYKDKENVLASNMLLEAMGNFGIIKGLDNQTYTSSSIPFFLKRNSKIFYYLPKIRKKITKKFDKGNIEEEYTLNNYEKKMLTYGANVWEKNIDFMDSVAASRSSRYLIVLQPTLGLDKDYCKNKNKKCMLTNQKYIKRINFLYSLMRKSCDKRTFCLDISKDFELNTNESLYTDARHPNSNGNKRVADLMMKHVVKILDN